MKQEIVVSGRLRLSPEETGAAFGAALTGPQQSRAIEKYLAEKSEYYKGATHVSVARVATGYEAVVDIKSTIKDNGVPKFIEDPKVKRNSSNGFARPNSGIGAFLKEYLGDEQKKKSKQVKFERLYSDVKDLFPDMTEKLLAMYVHDKRVVGERVQLKLKEGVIELK